MGELAKRPDDALAEFEVEGERPPNPLKLLPKDLRKPVSFFWMLHKAILPTVWPVATMLATWMKEGEVTIDDAKAILRRLAEPDMVARFRFQSDLTSELGHQVNELRRKKRNAAQIRRARGEAVIVPEDKPAPAGGAIDEVIRRQRKAT